MAEEHGKRPSERRHSSLYPGRRFQTHLWLHWHKSCVAGSTSGESKTSLRPCQSSADLVQWGRSYDNGVWAVPSPVTGLEDQQWGVEEAVKNHTGWSRFDRRGVAPSKPSLKPAVFPHAPFCLSRSRLCGVRRGSHPAQQRVRDFQSLKCSKDEEEGGADRHPAPK